MWEIREVLRNKFEVSDAKLNLVEHDLLSLAKLVKVRSSIRKIKIHAADNAILACAIDGGAEVIISGDKHLLSLEEFEGVKILPPASFLAAG